MEAVLDTEVQEVEKETTDIVAQATGVQITTPEGYSWAANFLKSIKTAQKRVETTFEKSVTKARDSWKEACKLRDSFADPLSDAEKLLKGKMSAYDREQERIAAEAQAKIDADARKTREEAEARAQKREDKGNVEKAEQIRQNAESAPVPVIVKSVPKVDGVKYTEFWIAEVTDPSQVPDMFWAIDQKAIDAFVKSTKGKTPIAGVKITSDKRISSGGR